MEHAGVISECRLMTRDAEDTLDFEFDSEQVVSEIIIAVRRWLVF